MAEDTPNPAPWYVYRSPLGAIFISQKIYFKNSQLFGGPFDTERKAEAFAKEVAEMYD